MTMYYKHLLIRKEWTNKLLHFSFCLSAFILVAKPASANLDDQIQCTLSKTESLYIAGQPISIDINIHNTSTRTLHVLWLARTYSLEYWGALTISIVDESGKELYQFIPAPGPIHLRSSSHYQQISPGTKLSHRLDVCWLHDIKRSSASQCSPGKFTLRVKYNGFDDYWDLGSTDRGKFDEAWTGETMCSELKYEIFGLE